MNSDFCLSVFLKTQHSKLKTKGDVIFHSPFIFLFR